MPKGSLIDISRAKPQTSFTTGEHTVNEIDLLWPYRVHRIAVDTDENVPKVTKDCEYIGQIQSSVDGKSWITVSGKWNEASKKSQYGSGPTHVVILDDFIVARFVRILFSREILKPRLRIIGLDRELQSSENLKFSIPNLFENESSQIGIGIVGDSNAVMRYGMKKALSSSNSKLEFDATLGASSIIFAARTLETVDGSKADAVIINANVVEYPLLQEADYDHELGEDAVRHILAHCYQYNSFPVRVIWPQMKYLMIRDSEHQTDLSPNKYFAKQSERLGIPYVDGYRLLDKIARDWGRTHVSLFKYRDEAHLSHMPSQVIGDAIRRLLVEMYRAGEFDVLQPARELARKFMTAKLPQTASPVSLGQIISNHEIRTSLIDQDFLELKLNDSILVPIPEGFEVVGYLINARRCNATLKVSGLVSASKRVNFVGFQDDVKAHPFVCARTLPYPVRPTDGYVRVSCVPFSDTDHSDNICRDIDSDYQLIEGKIHIGDLILRSIEPSETVVAVNAELLDLTDRVELY